LTVPPNNLDDLEPWSKTTLRHVIEHNLKTGEQKERPARKG
jgi:hypothetical protein